MVPADAKLVVIGGGTGNFTLLRRLKQRFPDITAIVNMSDDGGSTGMLRDEYGVLPPGDIRQCLVALSDTPDVRNLFNYRFDRGSLQNQSLGNVILSGLELQHGNFAKAVEVAGRLLHITGRVVPTTLEKHTLIMRDGDETVKGQFKIVQHHIKSERPEVYLEPAACLNPEAAHAIEEADMIVVSPGNLYGSLVPALSVQGMREALQKNKAVKVMVASLVNKPGQTDGWHVADYVRCLERSVGEGLFDYVLYNDEEPSDDLLARYAAEGELPVSCEQERFKQIKAQAIGSGLVAQRIIRQDPNDTIIRRTLIRHDGKKVAELLQQILTGDIRG